MSHCHWLKIERLQTGALKSFLGLPKCASNVKTLDAAGEIPIRTKLISLAKKRLNLMKSKNPLVTALVEQFQLYRDIAKHPSPLDILLDPS